MRGFTKGEAMPPPLELNYITFSPSRTAGCRLYPVILTGGGKGGGIPIASPPAGEAAVSLSQPDAGPVLDLPGALLRGGQALGEAFLHILAVGEAPVVQGHQGLAHQELRVRQRLRAISESGSCRGSPQCWTRRRSPPPPGAPFSPSWAGHRDKIGVVPAVPRLGQPGVLPGAEAVLDKLPGQLLVLQAGGQGEALQGAHPHLAFRIGEQEGPRQVAEGLLPEKQRPLEMDSSTTAKKGWAFCTSSPTPGFSSSPIWISWLKVSPAW